MFFNSNHILYFLKSNADAVTFFIICDLVTKNQYCINDLDTICWQYLYAGNSFGKNGIYKKKSKNFNFKSLF